MSKSFIEAEHSFPLNYTENFLLYFIFPLKQIFNAISFSNSVENTDEEIFYFGQNVLEFLIR